MATARLCVCSLFFVVICGGRGYLSGCVVVMFMGKKLQFISSLYRFYRCINKEERLKLIITIFTRIIVISNAIIPII